MIRLVKEFLLYFYFCVCFGILECFGLLKTFSASRMLLLFVVCWIQYTRTEDFLHTLRRTSMDYCYFLRGCYTYGRGGFMR